MRRHRRLLNLIDHLPSDSAFVEAAVNDPEMVAAVAAGRITVPEDDEDAGPKSSDWSPVREALAIIADKLDTLTVTVMATAGAKKLPKLQPTPRPKTAMAAALRAQRQAAERRKAEEIIRIFSPAETADDLI